MVNIRGCYSYLTKTLQEKIDAICDYEHKTYSDPDQLIADINKAIQELREEIKSLKPDVTWHQQRLNGWYIMKDSVLALIGERSDKYPFTIQTRVEQEDCSALVYYSRSYIIEELHKFLVSKGWQQK